MRRRSCRNPPSAFRRPHSSTYFLPVISSRAPALARSQASCSREYRDAAPQVFRAPQALTCSRAGPPSPLPRRSRDPNPFPRPFPTGACPPPSRRECSSPLPQTDRGSPHRPRQPRPQPREKPSMFRSCSHNRPAWPLRARPCCRYSLPALRCRTNCRSSKTTTA